MGKIVLEKSDLVIFTMDDPRYESVDDIIDQMTMNSDIPYIRIINREEAIYKAFEPYYILFTNCTGSTVGFLMRPYLVNQSL